MTAAERRAACTHALRTIVKVMKANGLWEPRELCGDCGQWWSGIRQRDVVAIGELPVWRDHRGKVMPCERCGHPDTELHHWAPRGVFPDAEEWPQSWLCRECHMRWHRVMRPAVA